MALPAHHVAGLQVLVRAHLSGIPPIPLDSIGGAGHFSAIEFANATRAARAIADSDGAQLRTALVPTQLARIVEPRPASQRCALSAYDTILIGGAAAAHGLVARATSLGARIVTTYGMTGRRAAVCTTALPCRASPFASSMPMTQASGALSLLADGRPRLSVTP